MVRLAPRLYRNLLLIWYNHPADHPAVSSNSIERSGPSITGLRALHQFPQGGICLGGNLRVGLLLYAVWKT